MLQLFVSINYEVDVLPESRAFLEMYSLIKVGFKMLHTSGHLDTHCKIHLKNNQAISSTSKWNIICLEIGMIILLRMDMSLNQPIIAGRTYVVGNPTCDVSFHLPGTLCNNFPLHLLHQNPTQKIEFLGYIG